MEEESEKGDDDDDDNVYNEPCVIRVMTTLHKHSY